MFRFKIKISHTRAAVRERRSNQARGPGVKATPEGGSEATGTKASKRAKQPAEYKKNHLKVKNFKKF
jgi:hypothetical protein